MTLERLLWHCENWAAHMRTWSPLGELGYPSAVSFIPTPGPTFADKVSADLNNIDLDAALEFEVLVDALPPHQKSAMEFRWLRVIWVSDEPVDVHYQLALDNLMTWADKKLH